MSRLGALSQWFREIRVQALCQVRKVDSQDGATETAVHDGCAGHGQRIPRVSREHVLLHVKLVVAVGTPWFHHTRTKRILRYNCC